MQKTYAKIPGATPKETRSQSESISFVSFDVFRGKFEIELNSFKLKVDKIIQSLKIKLDCAIQDCRQIVKNGIKENENIIKDYITGKI